MIGSRPGWYWKITWRFVAPFLVFSILVASIVNMGIKPIVYSAWHPELVSKFNFYFLCSCLWECDLPVNTRNSPASKKGARACFANITNLKWELRRKTTNLKKGRDALPSYHGGHINDCWFKPFFSYKQWLRSALLGRVEDFWTFIPNRELNHLFGSEKLMLNKNNFLSYRRQTWSRLNIQIGDML